MFLALGQRHRMDNEQGVVWINQVDDLKIAASRFRTPHDDLPLSAVIGNGLVALRMTYSAASGTTPCFSHLAMFHLIHLKSKYLIRTISIYSIIPEGQ